MAGLATAFGSGAMSNSIKEIGGAKAILAIGSNTTAAHPIVALQVKDAVRRGAKLIVINPQEIELCKHADLFLQNRPGTDIPVLMGMMNLIVAEGLVAQDFIDQRCENYDEFKASLAQFDLETVAACSGVKKELIAEAAHWYATMSPASILYCMGITQHVHGTDNVLAIANIALLTGNIGKVSSGVNPLRGQNNVQGACDMGALPDVFPGYAKVSEAHQRFSDIWGCTLSAEPGKTHTEIFDGLHDGTISSMYLIGENPVLSEANAGHAVEAMKRANFMVVQDIFMSETAQLADVILPASSFAEKDGTFTNTERRVQRVRAAIKPVGASKPDWWIIREIAKRMGASGFDYDNPEEIFTEITKVVPAYGGINYARLDRGTLQWPCPDTEHGGTTFLHQDKFATQSGKGKFTPLGFRDVTEKVDQEYPLILTTDRSLFHFHGTMTRRVFGLNVLDRGEQLMIHPADGKRLDLTDGEVVEVISRRGKLKVKVEFNRACSEGTVSMSFHFSETPTNMLTSGALDPVAKTPGTKMCAVRLEKVPVSL